MLRTSQVLSSISFISPYTKKTSRKVKTRVLSIGDNHELFEIQIQIARMKAHWSHSEGRQEKAYIKIIMELEKKRDALLLDIKEKSL